MKVLLIGEPRSGKTTLLEGFIELVPDKQGFVTREVREAGERVGFELVSSLGRTTTLANVNSDSPTRVSRYGVELGQLDDFLDDLPPVEVGNILYVDEIGQMELFSDRFTQIIDSYLNKENPYLGTITSVYKDEFTDKVLSRGDIILLEVDPNNRDTMRDVLNGLASNIKPLRQLSPALQNGITKMAREYAKSDNLTQLKKLFKNTIKYLAENRIDELGDDTFRVRGNTGEHSVSKTDQGWVCDCDLFNGKRDFESNGGECSHIQSVKLKTSE